MSEIKTRQLKTSKVILILVAFTFLQLGIGIAGSYLWIN